MTVSLGTAPLTIFKENVFSVGERAFWAMSILRQLERTQFDHTFCLFHFFACGEGTSSSEGCALHARSLAQVSLRITCNSLVLSHFDASPVHPGKEGNGLTAKQHEC